MRKTILKLTIIILSLLSINVSAQEFQGQAYYQTQSKMDFVPNDPQLSESQKQEMQAVMKKQFEKSYILTFNKEASIYKEEVKLEQPNQTSSGAMFIRKGSGGAINAYKNTKTKKFTNEQDMFGKTFLVKDNLEVYDWVLGEESKVIGRYLCFKATAKREGENLSMSFKSKENDGNIKEPKTTKETITVTAWYTTDIPVSTGPDDYWGLPGLILELHNGTGMTYLCSKIIMNTKEKITEPTKGKNVDKKEFHKIMKKKMIERQVPFSNTPIRIGG